MEKSEIAISQIAVLNSVCRSFEAIESDSQNIVANQDWFNVDEHLGPRGHKYLTKGTKYALATIKAILDKDDFNQYYDETDIGVFTGTNFALYSTHKQMDHTILTLGSDFLEPAECANFSINIPSSLISIRNNFKAFNITNTTPFTAGIESLIRSVEAIKTECAKCVLAGSIEDDMPEDILAAELIKYPHGGASYFLLEKYSNIKDRGKNVLATISGAQQCFLPNKLTDIETQEVLDRIISKLDIHDKELHVCLPLAVDDIMERRISNIKTVLNKYFSNIVFNENKLFDYSFLTALPLLNLANQIAKNHSTLIVSIGIHGNTSFLQTNSVQEKCND
ncbi:beta-ketoacyl synthase N-terminal-like domain-containing protein [Aliikangiella sp. IMCC44359]|uniref:beta-ketoacyl synthase N-terminal-like domain-containing protein n=1 Tax=Aliikangiella sp. IMCC44359 TaxID=3459125 RepID=UPI00403AD1BA